MTIRFDENTSTIYFQPAAPLRVEDFQKLDEIFQQRGSVNGLFIETLKFPGWSNIYAFRDHLKFIKNQQSKIKKIALVTDSPLALFGEKVVGFFLVPTVKRFPFEQKEAARKWIEESI